ncbi:HNH endonuclease, partial [Vibrio fluvialis]|nr:HNH endonuclease [Vibrio fluvialis]
NSEKGKFTYNYFKLMDFEIESANQSQGKKTRRINNERAAAAFAALVG